MQTPTGTPSEVLRSRRSVMARPDPDAIISPRATNAIRHHRRRRRCRPST